MSPSGTPLGFTGHEGDDELGLVNMKGRIYDPKLGRFLTPDPLVSQAGRRAELEPVQLRAEQPARYVDPSGFDDQYVEPPVNPDF